MQTKKQSGIPEYPAENEKPAIPESNTGIKEIIDNKTPPETSQNEPVPEGKKIAKTRKIQKRAATPKPNLEIKPIRAMYTKESFAKENEDPKKEPNWLESEGQLAVDVFQTDDDLIIEAPIAGMKVEDLDVIIEEEIVTIKGSRKNPFVGKPTGHFIEECYWGPFSRKIILPLDTDGARADASMKEGILTIRIPKIQREKKRKVSIRE